MAPLAPHRLRLRRIALDFRGLVRVVYLVLSLQRT